MAKTIHPPAGKKMTETEIESLPGCDRYALLTLATNDAVWDLDLSSKHIEWNESFHRLFGYPNVEECSGLDFWTQKLHPDDLERVTESLESAMRGERDHWQEEYRFQKANGSYAYILDRGFLIRDHNRRPERMLGAMQDITARKLAEEKLRKNEQRFRALIEHSSSLTALFDAAGKVLYATPARQRILGFNAGEVMGKRLLDFIHPGDREKVEDCFANSLQHPRKLVHIEARAIHRNGSVRWLEGTFNNLLDFPAVEAVVCNYRDITHRKESEEERARLAAIIETTSDFVGMADANFRIFFLNKAARRALHIPATDNICQLNIADVHPPSAYHEMLQKAIPIANEQGIWSGETVVLSKNGDEIPVSQVILAHKSEAGAIEHYSTIFRDISVQKRAENAIRSANQELEQRVNERTAELEITNKELETFSYTVSHDLRAPVRAIQGMSHALQEECGSILPSDCREYLDRLSSAGQKMERLINDLLELAHINRVKIQLEQINLSELVRVASAELNKASPRDLSIESTPTVTADRRLLMIAVENLLTNAWKFTGKKENARIQFGSFSKSGETIYFLRDNGVGFDMKFAGRLFLPFERLHSNDEFEGTGIGLATVFRIINRLGGRIWAEGAVGVGATFYFTLPG